MEDVLAASTAINAETLELPDEAFEFLAIKYRTPSFVEKVVGATQAAQAALISPESRSEAEVSEIAIICAPCPHFIPSKNTCGACGCNLAFKPRLKAWHCPKGKW